LKKSKNLSLLSSNLKSRDTWPTQILCPSNHSHSPWDFRNSARVHHQTCPCKHWFRCRIFWAHFEHILWIM